MVKLLLAKKRETGNESMYLVDKRFVTINKIRVSKLFHSDRSERSSKIFPPGLANKRRKSIATSIYWKGLIRSEVYQFTIIVNKNVLILIIISRSRFFINHHFFSKILIIVINEKVVPQIPIWASIATLIRWKRFMNHTDMVDYMVETSRTRFIYLDRSISTWRIDRAWSNRATLSHV